MTNYRFEFLMDRPFTSPTPYGNRTRAVLPSAVKTIAENSNSWTAAPQITADLASTSGEFVECSFTYVKNISGMTEGWYFWRGYLDSNGVIWEKYEPVTYDPVGNDITLTLHNSNGTFFATYQDHTQGVLNGYEIQQAPDSQLRTASGAYPRIALEAPSSTTCSDYPNFTLQYTKYKYLNSAGDETPQDPDAAAEGSDLPSCISTDKTQLEISKP